MADEKLLNNLEDGQNNLDTDPLEDRQNNVSDALPCSCLPSACQCPCLCLMCVLAFFLLAALMMLIGILTYPAKIMQSALGLCFKHHDRVKDIGSASDLFSDVTPEVQAHTDNYSEMYAEKGFLPNFIFYIKQTHPVLAIFTAERSHPYRREDRIVQLFLLQGMGYMAAVYYRLHQDDLPSKSIFMMFASTLPQFIAAEALMKVALLLYRKWQVDHEETQFDLVLSNWVLAKIFLGAEREPDAKVQTFQNTINDLNFDNIMDTVKEKLKDAGVYLVKFYFAGYMGALGVCLFCLGTVVDLHWTTICIGKSCLGGSADSIDWNPKNSSIAGYAESTLTSWCTFFILSFLKFGAKWFYQHLRIKNRFLASFSLPLVGKCGIAHNHDTMVKLCDAKRLANTVKKAKDAQMKLTYEEFEGFVKLFAEKEHLGHMLPSSFKVSVGDEFEYYVSAGAGTNAGDSWMILQSFLDPGWCQVRVTGVDGNQVSVELVDEETKPTFVEAIKNGVPKTSLKSKDMLLDSKQILSTFQRIDGNSDGLITTPDFVLWAAEVGSQLQGYRPIPPSLKKFIKSNMGVVLGVVGPGPMASFKR
jgi:hypothetical protein